VVVRLIAIVLLVLLAQASGRPQREDADRRETPFRPVVPTPDSQDGRPTAVASQLDETGQKGLSLEAQVVGIDGQPTHQSRITF